MDSDLSNFSIHGHIKDEIVDDYGRAPPQETIPPERRENWANPAQPEGSRQTSAASNHDAYSMGMSSNRINGIMKGAFRSLPYPSVSMGNTFHIPPFRCLAETAGAGEYHVSLPPMMPTLPARYDIPSHLYQAPLMPPDGAFLHSNDLQLRHPNRPPGQYDLPSFSAQESAYALENGHAYPRDMPAPRMLPPTMDPSRLLHRHSPMPAAQAESASESEAEMDDGGEPDPGWDWRFGRDDAAGWANHPDTIGLGNPHFYATKTKGDMRDAAGVQVPVEIHARFVLKKRAARQRNFWILYRRNYFGVQGSYHLEPLPDSTPKETLYLHRKHHKPKPIQALFMCMRGVVETEEGPEIKIVVFNAKRKPLHEGQDPPPIEPQRMKPLTEGSTKYYAESTGDRQDHLNVPMNHTFHRNQFRAATQNNGARRTEQQFYHILLELKAEIMVEGVPKLFTVASRLSEPLVVRGRCPLSFKNKDEEDCHTRDSDRKGRKPPRGRVRNGSRKDSLVHRPKEGQAKAASRGPCNKTGGSSRRSARASSSNLPSLAYGTGSRSTNSNTSCQTPISHTNGTVNTETIPHLEHKLFTYARDLWDGDASWLDGHESV